MGLDRMELQSTSKNLKFVLRDAVFRKIVDANVQSTLKFQYNLSVAANHLFPFLLPRS